MEDVDVEQTEESGDVKIKTPAAKSGYKRDRREGWQRTLFTEDVAREVRDQLDEVLDDGGDAA